MLLVTIRNDYTDTELIIEIHTRLKTIYRDNCIRAGFEWNGRTYSIVLLYGLKPFLCIDVRAEQADKNPGCPYFNVDNISQVRRITNMVSKAADRQKLAGILKRRLPESGAPIEKDRSKFKNL